MTVSRPLNSIFIARMEDILALYGEGRDPHHPLVCFDETLRQLVADVTPPLPPKPANPPKSGTRQRIDHHYRRNGTAYLQVALHIDRCHRDVTVTRSRSRLEFAEEMRRIVDFYPNAKRVRVVLDNLNIHNIGSLYDAFPPSEARRIAAKLEFHFTPVHGSWLNMVEIEIGVMQRQCLDRRIGSFEEIASEVAAWVKQRNDERATIEWMFGVEDARQKLGRFYPSPSL